MLKVRLWGRTRDKESFYENSNISILDYEILTCYTSLKCPECPLHVYLCYMEIFKGFSQINWRKSEKSFFNKDFPLDIVRKPKKILTVILRSIMQGNVPLLFFI